MAQQQNLKLQFNNLTEEQQKEITNAITDFIKERPEIDAKSVSAVFDNVDEDTSIA